jgi:hypothetical protein
MLDGEKDNFTIKLYVIHIKFYMKFFLWHTLSKNLGPPLARDASSSSRFTIPVVNQPRCHTPPPSFVAPTTSVSLLHAFATLTVSDRCAPVPRLRRPYVTLPLAPHRAALIYHLRLGGLLFHRRPGTCAWWAPDPGSTPPPVEL